MTNFIRWLRAALVLTGAFAALTSCQKPGLRGGLLRPVEAGAVKPPAERAVVRSREVSVDLAQLRGGRQRLVLPLFDDVVLNVVRERQEEAAGGLLWYGRVENQPGSTVTLALKGEVLIGSITTAKGKMYQIRYAGNRIHSVLEVDQSRFPPEKEPESPHLVPHPEADTCASDPPTEIDVLVTYTGQARAGAGSKDAMEAEILLAASETNQSYINSNINQRLRLVHLEEVTYTESGVSSTDKSRLQNPSDGILDNVPTMRNTHGADLAVLITETLDWCGESYIMETVSNAFESYGYAVVRRDCSASNRSFGHELGHIMGARHDWNNDATNNKPYAYNHGHFVTSPADSGVGAWRTMMAYPCPSGCTRLQYWSNPFVNYPPGGSLTDPMGTSTGSQQTDNHKTLNNTALTVANFRCSSPGVANVWMKDTWNDTGKEPDPATAGEDMWKSPYIWVRKTQDTALVHQHEHEIPDPGSSSMPWVYVKVHNGATAPSSGNLEIYYANASTSLDWPSGWTLIGAVPVSGFAAKSTRIVERQWTGFPGAGHYCLLARWVSAADPMAVAEGIDIGTNVRNNNNLVWRNLEVLPLGGDKPADASFIVRNSTRISAPATLWIRGPRGGLQPSFLPYGEVFVRLDEGLLGAWKQGGARGSGFKRVNGGLLIGPEGARIENLVLPPTFAGHVSIQFRRLPATPGRTFLVDVVHLSKEKTIGGVSYEIHTDLLSQ